MICPKCNNEIDDNVFICPDCGYEVQVVPDFDVESEDLLHLATAGIDMEPKINNDDPGTRVIMASETQVIGGVTKTQVIGSVPDKTEPETEPKIKPIELTKKEKVKEFIFKNNIFLAVGIAILILLIAILVIVFGKKPTWEDSYNLAISSVEQGDYDKAIEYVYDAMGYEDSPKDSLVWYLAGISYQGGKSDEAERIYLKFIEDKSEYARRAYESVIFIYKEQKRYEELAYLLENCYFEDIKKVNIDYMIFYPEFSLKEGNYEDMQPLRLSNPGTCKIYYTFNGLDPIEYGTEYTENIFLERGEYDVSAVCINKYGVIGVAVMKSYYINTIVPDSPYVYLDDGYYTSAKLIYVKGYDNYPVYYTTDSSVPNVECAVYKEPIPLLLGSHVYTFAAINEYGDLSEPVQKSYTLEFTNCIAKEDAEIPVYEKLYANGTITDYNGTKADGSGVITFECDSAVPLNDTDYYLLKEVLIREGKSNKYTGNMYGVNIYNGETVKLLRNYEGEFYSTDY